MTRSFIRPADGAILYRTCPMEPAQAQRFAKALTANKTRFIDVEIEDARTKTTKSFVTYRPLNPTRQGDLYQAQYDQRLHRAEEEGDNYIFWEDETERFWWCLNPLSGETYEVTAFGCTCPDYHYRCEKAGIHCKHQHAKQRQADKGMLLRYQDRVRLEAIAGGDEKRLMNLVQALVKRQMELAKVAGKVGLEVDRTARHARCTANINKDF